MKPYIGITDFMNFEQVSNMLNVLKAHRPEGSNRLLHVGVMMSHKTLNDIPTKWSVAFPEKEEIKFIFSSTETYNCIHFADRRNEPDLLKSLQKMEMYGNENLHAIQFDMTWPDIDAIGEYIYSRNKQVELILQVGQRALDEIDNDPYVLARKLRTYQSIGITRVLLDRSMGKGLPLSSRDLLNFLEPIANYLPDLGLVVAGGLSAETLYLIEPILDKFPNISWDAQGRLRRSGSALDPIDWDLAEQYLIRSLQMV